MLNPLVALKPQVAQGHEAGIVLTLFQRNTHDQIDFFDCFGPTSPACDRALPGRRILLQRRPFARAVSKQK
jgi:hypothetical protein